jgi:hypothetical protein
MLKRVRTQSVEKLDDARGVITGPMWRRDEDARSNGSRLVNTLRMGAVSVLLVMLAYVAAAWLDESQRGDVVTIVEES